MNSFSSVVEAGCSCVAIGNWETTAQQFLKSDDIGWPPSNPGSAQTKASVSQTPATPMARSDSFPNGKILKNIMSVSSSEVLLDVSSSNSYSKTHIKGAISIPAKSFLNTDGSLKPSDDLAKIIGNSGISRDDPVVLYGSAEGSGEPEFVFWVLLYLGHRNAKVLDGNLEDWKNAGLPVESQENKKPALLYKQDLQPFLIADYELVTSGVAQVVDARPFEETGDGRIPNSLSMDAGSIFEGGKLRGADDLASIFKDLYKDNPAVVYSSSYDQSALLWYSLLLMGFDARIYTWEDWLAHQSSSQDKIGYQPKKEATKQGKFTKLGRT